MYENTGPRAHEMAAELIAGGLEPHEIYRHLYEGVPQGKLVLLARGLTNVERFDDGLLTVTQLTEDDYRLAGADESFSEGVVDHLRSVEGTAVAGLVRAQLGGSGHAQGLAAGDGRPHRRLRDRPRGRRRRASPRGRLLHRAGLPRAGHVPAGTARAAALT